jgi:hypothetical protein
VKPTVGLYVNAEFKKTWSYATLPPYIFFMVQFLNNSYISLCDILKNRVK